MTTLNLESGSHGYANSLLCYSSWRLSDWEDWYPYHQEQNCTQSAQIRREKWTEKSKTSGTNFTHYVHPKASQSCHRMLLQLDPHAWDPNTVDPHYLCAPSAQYLWPCPAIPRTWYYETVHNYTFSRVSWCRIWYRSKERAQKFRIFQASELWSSYRSHN